ncbi:hypothetical protein GQ55_5G331700 [Panicum hallii var. hallii]|uniref:Uncharacterized protein n=1 Tax=Panicum hallii var. hallii TaxID=1504633 RepID=A0A2T7DLW4_9POAL|nr:hypothetical protein GQ55_5G331700 [Panicum hallii var. hallii]
MEGANTNAKAPPKAAWTMVCLPKEEGGLGIQPADSDSIFKIMDSLKIQLNTPNFMSIIILLCWTIWTSRNDLFFHGIQPSLIGYRAFFRKELVMHQVRPKHKLSLEEWINSFG